MKMFRVTLYTSSDKRELASVVRSERQDALDVMFALKVRVEEDTFCITEEVNI